MTRCPRINRTDLPFYQLQVQHSLREMSLTHVSLLWQLIFNTHSGAITNIHSGVPLSSWPGSTSPFPALSKVNGPFLHPVSPVGASQGCLRSLSLSELRDDICVFQSFYLFWHPCASFDRRRHQPPQTDPNVTRDTFQTHGSEQPHYADSKTSTKVHFADCNITSSSSSSTSSACTSSADCSISLLWHRELISEG